MNLLLDAKSWFSENWMLLLLVAILVAFLVFSYTKQKKELNNRNDLVNGIKKGTKIVTTAGVYGVVDSIENTTDGKVVTILTGNAKNQTSMTIHINAIMGIDNKSIIKEESDDNNEVEEVKEEAKEEPKVEKKTTTKSITKKTTKK